MGGSSKNIVEWLLEQRSQDNTDKINTLVMSNLTVPSRAHIQSTFILKADAGASQHYVREKDLFFFKNTKQFGTKFRFYC